MSCKIKATNKCNKTLSAYNISVLSSMTVLTRKPAANWKSPIFARDLNSWSPNSVSEYKKDDYKAPFQK